MWGRLWNGRCSRGVESCSAGRGGVMAARVDVEKGLGGEKVGAGGVRLKTVALPTEHGGWGITLEPVLLGLETDAGRASVVYQLIADGGVLVRDAVDAKLLGGPGVGRHVDVRELTFGVPVEKHRDGFTVPLQLTGGRNQV